MKRLLSLLLLLAAFVASARAQGCGNDLSPEDVLHLMANQEAGMYDMVERVQADYIVRLAFHILQTDAGAGGPSQADLDAGVENMNELYEQVGIQFIVSVQDTIQNSAIYNITTWNEYITMRGLASTANAIDLFFVNTLSWGGSNWCGYSSFSWDTTQGIGILNNCAANNALLAHEVGHYFDLLHTHETANGAECPDGSNCAVAGDLVCDTAADPLLSSGNVDGNCNYTGNITINCNGANRAFNPDPTNIMSYSPSGCQDFFSPGQITRARSTLVNLRSELLWTTPDLYHNTPGGWSTSLVPRSDATATTANCLVTPELNGNASSTWFNLAVRNGGDYSSPSHVNRIYVDNVYRWWISFPSTGAHSWSYYNNLGTSNVRGGLHAVHDSLDFNDQVPESNESNNRILQQFVWSPLPIGINESLFRSTPPDKMTSSFAYPNCDGFSFFNTSWWEAVAVMPLSATADYDIRLHNTYNGATIGFESFLASSAYGSGQPDWVMVNRNVHGEEELEAGVSNYDGETGNMRVERVASVTVSLSDGNFRTEFMDNTNILKLIELNVGVEDLGIPWMIHLSSLDEGDLNISLYNKSFDTGGRSTGTLANATAEGTSNETITYTFNEAGYYALVVYKDDASEMGSFFDFRLDFEASKPDLEFSEVVNGYAVAPLNGAVACGEWDDSLAEGITVATVGFTNTGLVAENTGGWNFRTGVDGRFVSDERIYAGTIAPGAHLNMCGVPLGTVTGGRHEVEVILDIFNVIEEDVDGEDNNRHFIQLAWEPWTLSPGLPVSRSSVPNWRNTENPASLFLPGFNQDGYSLQTSYWAASVVLPESPLDAINQHGYMYHSTDPELALIDPVESSYPAQGASSLMAFNGNLLGSFQTFDLGVSHNLSWPANPANGGYVIEYRQSMADLQPGSMRVDEIDAGSLLHVYDVNLPAGNVPVYLENLSDADLSLSFFDATIEIAGNSNVEAFINIGGAGEDEAGTVFSLNEGWHGLVIQRQDNAAIDQPASYRLRIGAPVLAPITNLQMIPTETDASDSELGFLIDFDDLIDVNGLPVLVDHYSYYWTYDAYADFPGADWYFFNTSELSELETTAFVDPAGDAIYICVLAVTTDGSVVASSRRLLTVPQIDSVRRACGESGNSIGVIQHSE